MNTTDTATQTIVTGTTPAVEVRPLTSPRTGWAAEVNGHRFQLWAPGEARPFWAAAWTFEGITIFERADSPSLALSALLRACPDVDAAVAAGTPLLIAAQKHAAGAR